MKADTLITGISQLVTAAGAGPKHGPAMRELKIVEAAAIAMSSGLIVWTGRESEWTGEASTTVDAGRRAVVPGLIDPHTHVLYQAGIGWPTSRREQPVRPMSKFSPLVVAYEAQFVPLQPLRRMSLSHWRSPGSTLSLPLEPRPSK